jgi:hypothetical protein
MLVHRHLALDRRVIDDWLHELSTAWLIVVVFGVTLAVTAAIYGVVIALARGERGRSFTAVSPGMLPPMGLVFGLVVGFLAAQVWSDADRAHQAVNREASSLRAVVLLSAEFPGQREERMQSLVHRHIEQAVTREWPEMADGDASLSVIPGSLAEMLDTALHLRPDTTGQEVAQREIVTSVENAFDARRQRIIVSESSVNWAKWGAVFALAILTLIAIAFVHSGNRLAAALSMALFGSAVAVSVLMIATHDRPFAGPFRVTPAVLVEVEPGRP